MPWKESHQVNERMHFVSRLKRGESMSDLCHEYGISRKTGYKFLERFNKKGPEGLIDESRRPITSPQATLEATRQKILRLKQDKPHWGADKLKSYLERKYPNEKFPSRITIYQLLCRHNLVTPRAKRQRYPRAGTSPHLRQSEEPNEIWCADFKGEFQLGNQTYCHALTVSDHFSRYLLSCEGLESTRHLGARMVFEQAFEEHGLPDAILSDNGVPFGAPQALWGWSRLSLWWVRLGIRILRIEPSHPEQNGRHERMHLTLKQQTTRPPGQNMLQQQERFDRFLEEFNFERPHQALNMKTPASIYKKSSKPFPKDLPEPDYKACDLVQFVNQAGQVLMPKSDKRFFVGVAFEGQPLGLTEENDEDIWSVTFCHHQIGLYDARKNTFRPLDPTST